MNEKNSHSMKNLIFNCMGITLTLAGLTYIAVQYSKLLSSLILEENPDDCDEGVRSARRISNRFKQIRDNEGVGPDVLEQDDITVEIEEQEKKKHPILHRKKKPQAE